MLQVMSYLAGGELFFHLRREGQLPEPRAQLYAAEILLALQVRSKACCAGGRRSGMGLGEEQVSPSGRRFPKGVSVPFLFGLESLRS